jgi:ParB family transcriptional regulator, chromosome partitioning protein
LVGNKIAANHLTVRAAEKLIKAILEGNPSSPVKAFDLNTLRLQDQLTAKLGAKVKIAHKENGQGNITIAYTSLDELDGIVAHFKLENEQFTGI